MHQGQWTTDKGPRTFFLCPPHFLKLLFDDHLVQEGGGFAEAFINRHQAIFVLDGEHIIVPHHLQGGDEIAPKIRVVAVTDSSHHCRAWHPRRR